MNKAHKAAMILRGEVEAWAYPTDEPGPYYFINEIVPVWERGRIKWYKIADTGKL